MFRSELRGVASISRRVGPIAPELGGCGQLESLPRPAMLRQLKRHGLLWLRKIDLPTERRRNGLYPALPGPVGTPLDLKRLRVWTST